MWITNGPTADVLVVYANVEPGVRHRRASRPSSSRRASRVSRPRRSSTSSACAVPTPASSCSRIARCRRRTCSAEVGTGRARAHERPRLRARRAGGRAARPHARMPRRRAAVRARAQAVRRADRHVPAHAGQARRHVHDAERVRGLRVRRGARVRRGHGRRAWTPPAASCWPPRRPRRWRSTRSSALGGNGYINDYPTGRLLRDAKLYEIGAGTSEIRRMLIGRELYAATG